MTLQRQKSDDGEAVSGTPGIENRRMVKAGTGPDAYWPQSRQGEASSPALVSAVTRTAIRLGRSWKSGHTDKKSGTAGMKVLVSE